MKRPEGFDPASKRTGSPSRATDKHASGRPTAPKPSAGKPVQREPTPVEPRPSNPKPSKAKQNPVVPSARSRSANPKKLTRERRRLDKAEVRRFTRRARARRLATAATIGTIVTLIGLVLIAVYSPLLALRTITVDGTSRVDASEVQTAVEGQLGTPLALIDFNRITTELGAFALIRTYVTETVPPDTLRIHIVERQPVGAILDRGEYKLVDPAGVVIEKSKERIPGLPVVDLGGAKTSSKAFSSIVEVLLAMPPTLLAQVDSISASTKDDVSLVLIGIGQHVRWGSADHSAKKAALLAALISVTDPARTGEFDVSAPTNGIFRPS
jgi:cell division protein FtsQ